MGFAVAINKTVQYEYMHCGECDMDFAVPDEFYKKRKEDGERWYCPRGHCRVFRDSDLERTKKALNEAQLRNNKLATELMNARNEADKVKKAKRKLEVRIEKGVCPCCNRTFANIQRHMATKHPEFP